MMILRILRAVVLVGAVPWVGMAKTDHFDWAAAVREADAFFACDEKASILKPSDCGLVNGLLTLNGWLEDVAEIRGIYAPPYHGGDFRIRVFFNGMEIGVQRHVWRPECLVRSGKRGPWRVESRLVPVVGKRAAVLRIAVTNEDATNANLVVSMQAGGALGVSRRWDFSRPRATDASVCRTVPHGVVAAGAKEDVEVAVGMAGTDSESGPVTVPPGGTKVFFHCVAIDAKGRAEPVMSSLRKDPEAVCAEARAAWMKRVEGLLAKMPVLETDNVVLKRLYYKSLLHLLLNEWNVPEFKLHPYYSTGGINGGCVCCYLWNYGEVYRLWPLVAPEATREHIKTFLRLDLANCYAFEPFTGGPLGPYYPVNQEKVIFLTHAYVLETGDVAFLNEDVDGRSVLRRLVEQALLHDDPSQPAVLASYTGNHHLELRKSLRYDGLLPDMNLRRVVCFRLVDELCRLVGFEPGVDLVARAEALKELVHERLWDDSAGWFAVVQPNGARELRGTMQMFKALGWGAWALRPEAEQALIRHLLSPKEYLGPYGLHSLSLRDPAYDEDDVDNGGPGACVSFAPAVADRLYRSGRLAEGDRIFMRLLWLGDALPYFGDSQYADRRDYRRDTPLQNDIQGAALAQTIIFGIFGIEVRPDFSVRVAPHLPIGTRGMHLRNVRVAGREFDVCCCGKEGVQVLEGGRERTARRGEAIVLPPAVAGFDGNGKGVVK